MIVQAQSESSIWRDDMNYQSLDQLQTAGWTITHQVGVSFTGSAIVLDGTQEDTAVHYSQHFPSGILNWKVEDRSRWTLGSHCGNSVTAITNRHSYTFMADGWYNNYAFYRDGQKTTFGSFQENKNEWFTLSLEKQGNQINMYYNGELKSTYTETDTSNSLLIGVDAVSPWRGGSEYDYFEVLSMSTSTTEPQTSLLSNSIVLGGIIGAVGVGVAGVLYFFVLGGSGAAGSSGGAVEGAGQGGHGSSGSSSQPEQPYSDENPCSSGQADPQAQDQYDNSQNSNYDAQQPEENPYSSEQTDTQSQQSQLDYSQNSNYDTEQPDSPCSSGQADPQAQDQYDNSQNSNYGAQQPEDNPYSSEQTDTQSQQSQYDNSQNNYESSRGTSENTKSNKKSSTKTE
jgi:hypothetical protein